jgi:cytochrome c-type biogenesis protein CcmH/NrfG
LLALNGKTAEAQASLDAALGLHPAHPELTLKRVALLFATRQPSAAVLAQARRLLQAALAQKPNDKRLLANLGFVALNQRNTDEARRLLQAALAQDPLYAPALESLRALP